MDVSASIPLAVVHAIHVTSFDRGITKENGLHIALIIFKGYD